MLVGWFWVQKKVMEKNLKIAVFGEKKIPKSFQFWEIFQAYHHTFPNELILKIDARSLSKQENSII